MRGPIGSASVRGNLPSTAFDSRLTSPICALATIAIPTLVKYKTRLRSANKIGLQEPRGIRFYDEAAAALVEREIL